MGEAFPFVEIITVNYNNLAFLEDFFRSLERLEYPHDRFRLTFADNGSRDGSLDYVRSLRPGFALRVAEHKRNLGFARANNLAFARSDAEYLALLNDDTRVDRRWLSCLVEAMQRDTSAGMACSRRIPEEAPRLIDAQSGETSWCSGGHCLIRRCALEKTGYFDEAFFLYGEDVDLSWRMWLQGFRCLYVPDSICEHHFGRPEKYRLRRLYFHVRNSLLLRYAYGTPPEIRQMVRRRVREGVSLFARQLRPGRAWATLAAVAAHLARVPYFLRKRKRLQAMPGFSRVKARWFTF